MWDKDVPFKPWRHTSLGWMLHMISLCIRNIGWPTFPSQIFLGSGSAASKDWACGDPLLKSGRFQFMVWAGWDHWRDFWCNWAMDVALKFWVWCLEGKIRCPTHSTRSERKPWVNGREARLCLTYLEKKKIKKINPEDNKSLKIWSCSKPLVVMERQSSCVIISSVHRV